MLRAKVLVVDDRPANVLLLERILGGAGYTSVMSTTDPRAVRDLHREHAFDLILLDLEMPGMDGFQVLDALQTDAANDYVPVAVISAHPGHKLRALQAGAKAFVSKPFVLAEMLSQVCNMLEMRLLHTQARDATRAAQGAVREIEANDLLLRRRAEELTTLYDQVVVEQKLAESLMLNVLPWSAAGRLRAHPDVVAGNHPDVTVLVADVRGFANRAQPLALEQVEGLLLSLFEQFDELARAEETDTLWTVGDPFVAVAGLQGNSEGHAERAVRVGLALVEHAVEFSRASGLELHLRVGVSSGPVIAAVGRRRFIYDLWGDTLLRATRLEAGGVLDRVVVADSTRSTLGPAFHLERRVEPERPGPTPPPSWLVQRSVAVAVNLPSDP